MPSLFLRTLWLVLTATRLTMAGQSSVYEPCLFWKDAIYASGKCYKRINKAMDYEDALKYCQEQELATLAEIHTDAQQTALKYIRSMPSIANLWLGARATKRAFRWLSNNHIIGKISNLWEDGEPSNNELAENCVELKRSGKFNDVSCTPPNGRPFACQKESQNSRYLTNIKVEDVEENNITLFVKPGPIKSKLVIKVMSFEECSQTQPNCRKTETIQEYAIFPSKELNFAVKKLQNSSQYSITFEAEGTNKKGQHTVNITTKNSTVRELQESTQCGITFEVEDTHEEGILGNQTVNIRTKAKANHNEELNPTVIGLSVGLALSILGIAVLAFLNFRLHRQMQNCNNSLHLKSKQTEGSSLKVGFKNKKTMSPVEPVSTPQSSSRYDITIKKNEGVGEYSNMPATAPNVYDQSSRDIDEHCYEMT